MAEAVFAEYGGHDALIDAVVRMRHAGYRTLVSYSPFSTEHTREALGKRPSRLPIAILVGGLSAAGLAYFLQWFLVAYLYPLNVGGRPPHMPLAFFIISFEMGVLGAAVTAFFGVLLKSRLPALYHPVFEVEGIETASVDRHWLSIDATNSGFNVGQVVSELQATGPIRIVRQGRAAP